MFMQSNAGCFPRLRPRLLFTRTPPVLDFLLGPCLLQQLCERTRLKCISFTVMELCKLTASHSLKGRQCAFNLVTEPEQWGELAQQAGVFIHYNPPPVLGMLHPGLGTQDVYAACFTDSEFLAVFNSIPPMS
jgi:hypothetical protein